MIPGLERSPGEGNGTPLHFSCLDNPWTEEPGGLQSMGSQRVDPTEGLTLSLLSLFLKEEEDNLLPLLPK